MLQLGCSRSSIWVLPASIRCLIRNKTLSRVYASTDAKQNTLNIDGKTYSTDDWTNVPPGILAQYGRKLHMQRNHPITITRKLIESRFPGFANHNDLTPVVTVEQNFDSLGFAADHPGRSKADTYYVNKDTVLRTHTSAHEVDIFRSNTSNGYTISADVYRRDAVDRSHYPVFHQMEGARTWDRKDFGDSQTLTRHIMDDMETLPKHDLIVSDPNPSFHPSRNPLQTDYHSPEEATALATHLKRSLENVVVKIFADAEAALRLAGQGGDESKEPLQVRWVEAFFPHTSPSWELEVWWKGDWLEVLGCGVIDQPLLIKADVGDRIGWAFGIGLERIAMVLFGIPDIRLFWSRDERFLSQFSESKPIRRFQPFSKYPAAPRDVAFWLPKGAPPIVETAATTSSAPSPSGGQPNEPARSEAPAFHENDLMEIVRSIGEDSVEDVSLVDDFTHPKTGRQSLCYRITYRSLEKTLTNEEANALHERVRQELERSLHVELR